MKRKAAKSARKGKVRDLPAKKRTAVAVKGGLSSTQGTSLGRTQGTSCWIALGPTAAE